MQFQFLLAALLLPLTLVESHFIIRTPTRIGYNDATQGTAPCGGFSATDRSAGVTNFPVGGHPIGLTTTHNTQTWTFRAALLSAPTTWVNLTPVLSQTGYPYFCEPIIPGIAGWAGSDAILQIIQGTSHGNLYGCAAIKFVTGGPASYSSTTCSNSSTVSASW